MTTLAVTPSPELNKLSITLTPEAEAKKAAALAAAEFIMAVASPQDQQVAIAAAADLKRFAKDVENAREDVKRPFLEAGRAIDAAARKAADSVSGEVKRLENLVGEYQRKEQAKADSIRREQEQIARDLDYKRLEAVRAKKAAEQEALRKEQEAARLAQEAKTKKEREAAALLRAKLEEERLEREFTEPEPTPPPIVMPPAPTAPKAEGAAVKREYDFEVTDIAALYAWGGQRFVKLEVERAILKYYINSPGVDVQNIPGVKVTETTKVAIRAAR
jgi:hypothetical protein